MMEDNDTYYNNHTENMNLFSNIIISNNLALIRVHIESLNDAICI